MTTQIEGWTRRAALAAVLVGAISSSAVMAGPVTIYCDEAAQIVVTRKNPDGTVETLWNSGYRKVSDGGFTDKVVITIPTQFQNVPGTTTGKAVRDGGTTKASVLSFASTTSMSFLEPFSIADLGTSGTISSIAAIYSLPDYLNQEGGLLPITSFVNGYASGVSALRVVDASSLNYSTLESAIYDLIARGDTLAGYSGSAHVGLTRTMFVPAPGAAALTLVGIGVLATRRQRG